MPLLLGLFLLVGVVLLFKWYGDADVKQIKASFKWTGLLIGLMLIVFLAATGRLGVAMGGIIAMTAWAYRVFGWWQMARQVKGMFGGVGFGRGAAGKAGQSSGAAAAFVEMELNHDTGELDGLVKKGRFAGRRLGTLSQSELLGLLTEAGGDPDSRSLLEAYLDRRWPEWREQPDAQAGARPAATTAMDEAEALRILGLAAGASADEIKAAYRRLMGQLHPDRGGSDYLAAKVNAAKDVLLKGRD